MRVLLQRATTAVAAASSRAVSSAPSAAAIRDLTEMLDHDNHEMRNKFRKFLSAPDFRPQ
jgi:hypothetical protein